MIMRNFIEWLSESTAQIQIDDSTLRKAFEQQMGELIERGRERRYQISMFNPTQFFQEIQIAFKEYPQLQMLMQALQSKNQQMIFQQMKLLRDWATTNRKDFFKDYRKIYLYTDFLDKENKIEDNDEQVVNWVKEAIQGTQQEMLKIKAIIEQAVSRIAHWNNSPIVIEPSIPYGEFNRPEIAVANSAHIKLMVGTYPPGFAYFQDENGKVEIDDVLEGGDEEMLETPTIQADYFNLINELRKPGSTSQGRTISLYTARPAEDREQLLQSNTLPINIFLANNYDHVEGLANDLSSGKMRDIWKVRIGTQYLTQTLDGPIKYYQVSVPNAPAKMELLRTAE